MNDHERMLLEDAIETAIRSEKENIMLRARVRALEILCVCLFLTCVYFTIS